MLKISHTHILYENSSAPCLNCMMSALSKIPTHIILDVFLRISFNLYFFCLQHFGA